MQELKKMKRKFAKTEASPRVSTDRSVQLVGMLPAAVETTSKSSRVTTTANGSKRQRKSFAL